MKKMFYVLLALLVSMVLVFGVSCDNSNKAPGGAVDLGTESVKVPDWAKGDYEFSFMDILPGTLSIDESGNFKVAVTGMGTLVDSSDPNCVTDIKYQNNDTDNYVYTLTAIVNVDLSAQSGEESLPNVGEESSEYSTFTMEKIEKGIKLTIDSDVSPINLVKDPLICNKKAAS